jgi:hypothetical protein
MMPKHVTNAGSGAITVGWTKEPTLEVAQIGVGRYDKDVSGPDAPLDSLFVDFSHRNQINSVIRALRRARDEAFGRDE